MTSFFFSRLLLFEYLFPHIVSSSYIGQLGVLFLKLRCRLVRKKLNLGSSRLFVDSVHFFIWKKATLFVEKTLCLIPISAFSSFLVFFCGRIFFPFDNLWCVSETGNFCCRRRAHVCKSLFFSLLEHRQRTALSWQSCCFVCLYPENQCLWKVINRETFFFSQEWFTIAQSCRALFRSDMGW